MFKLLYRISSVEPLWTFLLLLDTYFPKLDFKVKLPVLPPKRRNSLELYHICTDQLLQPSYDRSRRLSRLVRICAHYDLKSRLKSILNDIGDCKEVKLILTKNILCKIIRKLFKLDIHFKYLTDVQLYQVLRTNKEYNITFS